MTLGGFLTELAEVCFPCPGFLVVYLPEPGALVPAAAPALARAAFSSRDVFHVAISSSSIGEIPLAKKGIRLLRCFKQIIKAPTTSKAPTTESTVLSVMTRVWLLPLPDASLGEISVCLTISVAEAAGEVSTLEAIAIVVSLLAEKAGG
jgi:hypothetical protein